MTQKKLSIAILGTRGIPASYGGFETFAEELSRRLALRGHTVTVYGRRKFFTGETVLENCGQVQRRATPTIFHKYTETPLHALTSLWDSLWQSFDVILLCNAANSLFAFLPRLRGIPIAINVDGIERLRAKWNWVGRLGYKLGERCSVLFASRVVSDAQTIAEYYQDTFSCETTVITYGALAQPVPAGVTLERFNLRAQNYILYVSRLEPENNALGVIQAYAKVTTDAPLVIVGDAPYADEYKKSLRSAAENCNVIFTGFQFGEAYHELRTNCLCYVQATEVGGTHPALVEAMAAGNPLVANGTPENREVVGDAGLLYAKNDFEDLASKLSELLRNPLLRHDLSARARARAAEHYSWDVITDHYERLLFGLVDRG